MEILPRKQQLHHVFILVQVQFFFDTKMGAVASGRVHYFCVKQELQCKAFCLKQSPFAITAPQLFFVIQSCADLVEVGVSLAEFYQIIQV